MNLLFYTNINFTFESFFLQFVVLMLFVAFIQCTNNYYSLLYLFLLILFIGVILCLLNNELTAGFLWVGEILVVFVFLLLILYVNVHGDAKKFYYTNKSFLVLIFLIFALFIEADITLMEDDLLFLECDLYWVDYYEALNDYNNNDLYGFFVSYYILNNLILMIFGIILFFGSIICVLLFRSIKVVKFNNMGNFFDALKFSQNFLYSIFMRKQDMFEQGSIFATLKAIYSKND